MHVTEFQLRKIHLIPTFGHIFTEAGTQVESIKMNKACSELEDGK